MARLNPSLVSLLASFAAWLMCVQPALGDGKVFYEHAGPATMPDQRALICYADGVETLAIDTTLANPAGEVAWIVPVPSPPEILPVTSGVFPTLEAVFRPHINGRIEHYYLFISGLALAVVIRMGLKKDGQIWLAVTAFLLVAAFAGLVFLPALGTSRGLSGSPTMDVEVIDCQVVGAYDVATLTGKRAAGLAAWLRDEGFAVDPEAEGVIDAYLRDGWVFVASRLRVGEGGERLSPHPLALRFSTDRPVYPMRLTGVQDEPLDLTLYVFGDGLASVEGMRVQRSSPTNAVDRSWNNICIDHRGISALVGSAPRGTELRATLKPGQMSRDLLIVFSPGPCSGETVYTRDYAVIRGLNVAAGALLVLSIVVSVGWGLPRCSACSFWRAMGSAAAISLGSGIIAGVRVPTVAARPEGRFRPYMYIGYAQMILAEQLETEESFADLIQHGELDDAFGFVGERWRSALDETFATMEPSESERRFIQELREGDSPNCYEFTWDKGMMWATWYSPGGRPHSLCIYEPPADGS